MKKKFLKLYIPFVLTNLLYIIYEMICGNHISILGFIFLLLGGSLINPTSWYIIAIFIFYVLFYVAFKYMHVRNIIRWAVFSYIIWVVFCIYGEKIGVWNVGSGWYVSTLPFVVGVVWAEYKRKIDDILSRSYLVFLLIIVIGFLMSFVYNIRFGNNIYAIASATLYPILCNLILMKIKVGNQFWKFLGNISLELYLVHSLILNVFQSKFLKINSIYIYCFLAVTISIIVAKILHDFFVRADDFFEKKVSI